MVSGSKRCPKKALATDRRQRRHELSREEIRVRCSAPFVSFVGSFVRCRNAILRLVEDFYSDPVQDVMKPQVGEGDAL